MKDHVESGLGELLLQEIPALSAFCENKTPAIAEGLLRAFHNMSRTTCKPFVNKSEKTHIELNDGLWVVESSPTGECGILDLSSFHLPEPDKASKLWNYRAQKTITNKAGKANGVLDCSLLDETPQEYQWTSPAIRADCTFLD
jgi:hypothetical protein